MYKNNKQSKNIIAMLLLFTMLLSACGSTETEPGNNSTENDTSISTEFGGDTESESINETAPLNDGLEDVNMNGFSLTFLSYDGTKYWWSRNQIDATEINADAVNDSIYNRNAAIETRFNAQIQEKLVPLVESDLNQDVLAGTTDYQVAMVNDQKINGCLVTGSLLMWNDMPGCNLNNIWWNADANNVFQINGQQYAAVGDFNLSEYSKSYLIYFNKDLYSTLNSVSDLYKMALDGKWTYETFLSLGKQYSNDLDGDGDYDEMDQYGIAGMPRVMYQQLLTGAGVKYVDIGKDGNPYFAVQGNEHVISVMQKISEDFGKTNTYFNSDSGMYMPMFSGGQLVFLADTMYDTEYYRSYEINIGMLPSPKWNEAQENYHSITVGGVVSALPKTLPAADQKNVGMLMEAMAFSARQDTLPAYKETVLQGKYVNDKESAEIVDIIFNSQTYDLGVTVWDVRGHYMSNIFEKNSTDVVSSTETIKNIIDSQIQATIDEVSGKAE